MLVPVLRTKVNVPETQHQTRKKLGWWGICAGATAGLKKQDALMTQTNPAVPAVTARAARVTSLIPTIRIKKSNVRGTQILHAPTLKRMPLANAPERSTTGIIRSAAHAPIS